MTDDELFDFPTQFPIKAMGRDAPEFCQTVADLVAAHAQFDPGKDIKTQASKNGNFLSVTVTFTATDREQLDTIYQSLNDHKDILMVF